MAGAQKALLSALFTAWAASMDAFSFFVPPTYSHRHSKSKITALNLIPLTRFRDELSFFSTTDENRCCVDKDGEFTGIAVEDGEVPFELCIVEESDLPEVALCIVKAFGPGVITMSINEFSGLERRLMEPALDYCNAYAAISAFAEVLWGLRIRLTDRVLGNCVNDVSAPNIGGLSSEKEKIEASDRKSLLLVMARPSSNQANNSSKWESIESNIDVIASVELRLQPCDAKIPFSLPWWDAIERKIAAFFGFPNNNLYKSAVHLQPYLSTLCVDETYRGQQIGRALVRCLEDIAVTRWGYSKMYLHVDGENAAALKLYKSEGYLDVGRRWNPFWAGRAADIGYFVKELMP